MEGRSDDSVADMDGFLSNPNLNNYFVAAADTDYHHAADAVYSAETIRRSGREVTCTSLTDIEAGLRRLNLSGTSIYHHDPLLDVDIRIPDNPYTQQSAGSFEYVYARRQQHPNNGTLRLRCHRPLPDHDRPILHPAINSNIWPHSVLSDHRVRSRLQPLPEQYRGRIGSLARDQDGYRPLEAMLAERNPEQTAMIFLELKDQLHDFMTDEFGFHVAMNLFEVCSVDQMNEILFSFFNKEQQLLNICVHPIGTRVMQSLVSCIKTLQQKSYLVALFSSMTITLSKNQNSQHIIVQCLRYFPFEVSQPLISDLTDNCFEIAMDKSGCCTLQMAVTAARGMLRDRLVAIITANSVIFSENCYGNYVVQHVLEMGLASVISQIAARFKGFVVNLATNKFGSHVLEKCFTVCGDVIMSEILQEIVNDSRFLDVCKDDFGNYVIQRALEESTDELREALVSFVLMNERYLQNNPRGKKVLAAAKAPPKRRFGYRPGLLLLPRRQGLLPR